MASTRFPCQTRAMAPSKPLAGGFFIFAAIVIGLVWGAANGEATRGVLFGTILGIVLAVLVWLFDRVRRP